MAVREPSSAGGGKQDERKSSFCKPELYYDSQLKLPRQKKTLEKVFRDLPDTLTSLCNFGVVRNGYDIPKGKHTASKTRWRVALSEDQLDIVYGRTQHWYIYQCVRRAWNHNWFFICCTLPWVIYQIWTGYNVFQVMRSLWHCDWEGFAAHHHAAPLLAALSAIGAYFNSYFGWTQTYMVVTVGAQAIEQAMREIWNAEQEKTSQDTVASAPVQTRVSNECCDAGKKMPSIKKLKYACVCKFITAALALGIAELHDDDDESFEVADDALVDGAEAERAESDDHKPMLYKVLRNRTSTAPPNELRESVVVKEKPIWQLFEERQKGFKVEMPDEKLIDMSGVILTPEVIEVIRALQPNKTNEYSGLYRHLKNLKHPLTGELLKMPTKEVEERLNLAAETIGKHFAKKARENLAKISNFKPPEKWSETMKNEMPERAEQARQADGEISGWRQRMLKGFNKVGEFMLPIMKHARLIGNLGPVSNMEDAMSIGPLENLMKECYPHLITKKMTLDETDEAIADLLYDMLETGYIPSSDDYGSMDAGWTKYDRYRMRLIANYALEPIREHLNMTLRNYDHVLDADTRKKKIKWQLRYLTVLMDPKDSILFSGERMTSLMNRWLVLTLEGAEDIRCLGEEKGVAAINATLDGTRKTTRGDGDDNLQGIPKGRYKSQRERIDKFAQMYKILEPCSAFDETRDAELLSRYHIWCGKKLGYVHIAKLNRNLGRLIAFKIVRSNLQDDEVAIELTQKELAMICTDVWQRTMSLKSTMVVRHYARATFNYAYGKIKDREAGTVYDDDMKRLGREDGDRTLRQCWLEINEVLSTAPTSSWAMVKVANFNCMSKLKPTEIGRMQLEWEEADHMMSTMEFDDKHVLYPDSLFEDFPIPSRIATALGLKKSCIDVCVANEIRREPQHDVDTSDMPPLIEEGAENSALHLESPGELADVASLTSAFGGGDTPVVPASETMQADVLESRPIGGVSESSGIGRIGERKTISGLSFVYVDHDLGWVTDCSDNEDLIHICCMEAGAPSGPALVERKSGNSDGVNTSGGPKSNHPNVHGWPCSGGTEAGDDVIDKMESGTLAPPGLERSETMAPEYRSVQSTSGPIPVTVAPPQVLSLSSLLGQVNSGVTSSDPGTVGKPRGAERGMARTNSLGQDAGMAERRGSRQSPAAVVGEPRPLPKTPTALSGSNGNQAAGGSRCSHSSIVESGSQSHGTEQANRYDNRDVRPSATGNNSVPGLAEPRTGVGVRRGAVRRGTRGGKQRSPERAAGSWRPKSDMDKAKRW